MAQDAKRVVFVYFDAGGGHRSTMNALFEVMQCQQRPWTLLPANLQEVLDAHDPVRMMTGVRTQDVYNRMLASGWTVVATPLLPLFHLAIRLRQETLIAALVEFWEQQHPDMVVSVISNFNRALALSIRRWRPSVPFVTVITDIADLPPHLWIEHESEYLVCGSKRAMEQARGMGHAENRIFQTSGMVIHPRFYESPGLDREAERVRIGLQADYPTGIVLFGGSGSQEMLRIAERLDGGAHKLQMIFICGRNEQLANSLRRQKRRYPFFVEGFTTEIPYYMRLSDFFIGKPGPASLSEALAFSLPVIVVSNAWTLPQERYNAEWVRSEGVGIVLRSFGDVNRAVAQVLAEPCYGQRASALRNRAVFEIPDILQKIFDRAAYAAACADREHATPTNFRLGSDARLLQ